MRELAGRAVAITGASSGIGAATARALVDAGASVVLGARRLERLTTVTQDLGMKATPVQLDVRSVDDCRRFVDAALERFGQLDSLVCSAGIGAYGGILDAADHRITEMVETNLLGSIWPIRAALPSMLAAGHGDLVLISSVAGLLGGSREAVYAATKFAQVGLARSLDLELQGRGIRTTVVCPGGVRTEFAMGAGRTRDMPELGAMMDAADVAASIVILLSQPQTVRTRLWWLGSMAEA
jgi:NADP-dependent 3-hydroxy acid dehydrogenase YdfG